MKQSVVYFITTDYKTVKIGVTTNLQRRIKTIQTSCDNPIVLLYFINADRNYEALLHDKFKTFRTRNSGEWFYFKPVWEWIKHDKLEKETLRKLGYIK